MPNTRDNESFKDALIEQWPLDIAIDWINSNMDPDDVFSEEQLKEWALNNGMEVSNG